MLSKTCCIYIEQQRIRFRKYIGFLNFKAIQYVQSIEVLQMTITTRKLRNGPVFFEPVSAIVEPLQFKIKGSDKIATAFPIYSANDIPEGLVDYLFKLFNKEIEDGLTFPYYEQLNRADFINYWFNSFTVVLLATEEKKIQPGWSDWENLVLGTFYIKPNYVGRCSHNCNAGFLVSPVFRGQKVGYRLGQVYLKWAPLLGYKYSVFNLVFETNPGSWKIWDKLKFDRIGFIPGVGILKGIDEPVSAIMFGKDLTKIEAEIFDDFC